MEAKLYEAVESRLETEVETILRDNKKIDINWANSRGWTSLHRAAWDGDSKIAALLLSHPGIDVNRKNEAGLTPFCLCMGKKLNVPSCVHLLLGDYRVDLNEPDNNGCTPLWNAASIGYVYAIKRWIASGREIYLGQPGNTKNDAILRAKDDGMRGTLSLLEGLRDHPEQTRHEVRKEINWYDTEAAGNYALVIFLCDELLSLVDAAETANPEAVRFLRMTSRLPMELQMKVSNMAVGSTKESVTNMAAERAFKNLAKKLKQDE